ncbi:MAG: hypothetical protein RMJ87_05710, partial [Cytophagales bacterium]|nr:hypothetical protein [Bernardetiaceae bacterium]MDW8204504.1 hypothetical protein [Cytophagales bacterium]
GAVGAELFNIPALVSLITYATVILHILYIVGILAYLEKVSTNKLNWIVIVIIAFLLLFLQGIFLETYRNYSFLAYSEDLHSNLLSAIVKRNAPYYLFAILLINMLRNPRFLQNALIGYMMISIATITALPAVWSATAFIVFGLITSGYQKEYPVKHVLFFVIILPVAIGLFNYVCGIKGLSNVTPESMISQILNISLVTLRSKLNLFIGVIFLTTLLYLPWFIVVFTMSESIKKLISYFLIITIIITLFGAFLWALFSPNPEVFQFFVHTTFSLLNTYLITSILATITSEAIWQSKKVYIAIPLMAILLYTNLMRGYATQTYVYSFDNKYGYQYLKDIYDIIQSDNINPPLATSIYALNDVSFNQYTSPLLMQMGDYLLLMSDRMLTYTISNFTIHDYLAHHLPERLKDLALMAFTQFVNRQKAEGTFQSIAQSQADFIRKHRIGYLIASKSAVVPPTIQPMITDSIVDSKSGERFYLLKP